MQICQNQTAFGQSYKIHAKNKDDADRLDLMLSTCYNVERKPDSKKMLITPRKEYLSFQKTAIDIASARFPKDADGKNEIMREWARQKTQNDIMEQIMANERKHAIDINI